MTGFVEIIGRLFVLITVTFATLICCPPFWPVVDILASFAAWISVASLVALVVLWRAPRLLPARWFFLSSLIISSGIQSSKLRGADFYEEKPTREGEVVQLLVLNGCVSQLPDSLVSSRPIDFVFVIAGSCTAIMKFHRVMEGHSLHSSTRYSLLDSDDLGLELPGVKKFRFRKERVEGKIDQRREIQWVSIERSSHRGERDGGWHRDRLLERRVGSNLRHQNEAILLWADINATRFSPLYRNLRRRGRLNDSQAFSGIFGMSSLFVSSSYLLYKNLSLQQRSQVPGLDGELLTFTKIVSGLDS